ncbi:hypothetical protein HN51_049210 [Arachis hypogaea]|uniref:Uncharacterized protein n=1 Tax=Arachis hypogaea TaxID=3818 RepID=A0A444YFN2_ARAHY|nr:uncharacterized protein LOC107608014 [Arachis ipaensis]XP_016165394.1 uncharacterized protein LOC107608014 [Arachis ipaensis]XP_025667560.1 uncharacterized protein LOC112765909 [Arachis hypogaea]XP_025667561.1 uncharacterized protein LOC112765909 [Arachis hypogaea]RYR00753.1 hypothetical protein Ahy_B07g088873 isoform B [Arachis hypogaea]
MFGTAVRFLAKKSKPKMGPIAMKTPPEQRNTITAILYDIVKEHGPITVSNTWERVKEVGLKDLTSKNHMKIMLRWMRERQKLRLLCNHVGAHKQFLYTTWFIDPAAATKPTPSTLPSKQKPSPS